MWLHIDDPVARLADPNCPRRHSTRVEGAYELVAHENYIVYFDQDEAHCTVTVRAAVPLMATSNSPTCGQSNSPRQDG